MIMASPAAPRNWSHVDCLTCSPRVTMAAPEDEDEGEEAAGVVTGHMGSGHGPCSQTCLGCGLGSGRWGRRHRRGWRFSTSGILRSVQGVIESTTVMSLFYHSVHRRTRIQPTFRRTNYWRLRRVPVFLVFIRHSLLTVCTSAIVGDLDCVVEHMFSMLLRAPPCRYFIIFSLLVCIIIYL